MKTRSRVKNGSLLENILKLAALSNGLTFNVATAMRTAADTG